MNDKLVNKTEPKPADEQRRLKHERDTRAQKKRREKRENVSRETKKDTAGGERLLNKKLSETAKNLLTNYR